MAQLLRLGDFMTAGEERTAEYLRDHLPDSWDVIANKIVSFPNGIVREIDFIVVGKHRLFIIDEKGFRGKIHGTESYWILSSQESRENPLNKMEMVARKVAGYLREQITTLWDELGNVPFVDALIVLSEPDAEYMVQEPRRERIVCLANCKQALERMDKRGVDQSIAPYRTMILQKLGLLSPRESLPRLINTFRIVEELPGGPHYRAFLAQHEAGGKDSTRRLKMYRLSGLTELERNQQSELIFRDYHALTKLAETGLVPTVESPFTWGDNQYMVVPQRMVAYPSLRVFVAEHADKWDTQARLHLAGLLLSGLAALHAQGALHRNLTPDNLSVDASTNKPRIFFTDFDFARLPESTTIAEPSDSLLLESPYRAPELQIAGMGMAEAASDVYSLGIILAELFTGLSVTEMQDADGCLIVPPLALEDSYLTTEEIEELRLVLSLMTETDTNDRCKSAEQAQEFMADLLANRQAREVSVKNSVVVTVEDSLAVPVEKKVQPDVFGRLYQPGEKIEDRYEVERILGQGATANTYLVRDMLTGGYDVLKQLRDPMQARSLALNEYKALKQIQHPNIMRVFEVQPPERQFHLRLEFVEGYSVYELAQRGEFPWSVEKVISFGCDVLDALEYLEGLGRAHRDISPRNIIITPSDVPKLIDFGFAATLDAIGQTNVGTIPYRAPELDRNEGWNKTCDLYALGAILYQTLTGSLPFSQDMTGRMEKSILPVIAEAAAGEEENGIFKAAVLDVILRAIHPLQENRYGSAKALREALRASATWVALAETEGERVENGWVANIQGLYRNSRVGNADNRGLDTPFAHTTYVPTRLDTELLPRILGNKYQVLLLSGNPGDGKTAFLEKLCDELDNRNAQKLHRDENGWQYVLDGVTFAANYDASESHNGKRANELLDEILEPFQGNTPPHARNYTVLLAINDGKLRDFLIANPKYVWLGEQVRRLLETQDAKVDARIAHVDLKQRTITGASLAPQEDDLFAAVLDKLLIAEGWNSCAKCRARNVCPMKFNRDTLAHPETGAEVRTRLRSLLQITHLRRERHITMRDLRSVLAYIVAGTTTCNDIHMERENTGFTPSKPERLYFLAAFNPQEEGEENLQDFMVYDPAFVPIPRLDRFLHFRRRAERLSEIENVMLAFPGRANAVASTLSPTAQGDVWHEMIKRRIFFEGDAAKLAELADPLSEWKALLPYRHFAAFLDAVSEKIPLTDVKDKLCEAISRANGIVENYDRFLCIRTGHNSAVDLTVFKRFPTSDFVCSIVKPRTEQVETLPNALRLRHTLSDAELLISLDLFEILMRFTEGYHPDIEEQEPFVTDLNQFQNRLLNQHAEELLLLEGGRKLHHVRQKNGIIELINPSNQTSKP